MESLSLGGLVPVAFQQLASTFLYYLRPPFPSLPLPPLLPPPSHLSLSFLDTAVSLLEALAHTGRFGAPPPPTRLSAPFSSVTSLAEFSLSLESLQGKETNS